MIDRNGKEFKPGQWVSLNFPSPFRFSFNDERYECYKLIRAEHYCGHDTLVVDAGSAGYLRYYVWRAKIITEEEAAIWLLEN